LFEKVAAPNKLCSIPVRVEQTTDNIDRNNAKRHVLAIEGVLIFV